MTDFYTNINAENLKFRILDYSSLRQVQKLGVKGVK